MLEKINNLKAKYKHSKEETNHQIKICNLIKSNLEELIESKTAFENVLNILNNEIIALSRQIEKERESDKGSNKGSVSSKNNGKSMFTNQKKKSILPLLLLIFYPIQNFECGINHLNRKRRFSPEFRIWKQEQ